MRLVNNNVTCHDGAVFASGRSKISRRSALFPQIPTTFACVLRNRGRSLTPLANGFPRLAINPTKTHSGTCQPVVIRTYKRAAAAAAGASNAKSQKSRNRFLPSLFFFFPVRTIDRQGSSQDDPTSAVRYRSPPRFASPDGPHPFFLR